MPTREQYERAIGRAQRAGDDEAVQELIKRARGMVTGEGSLAEKFGAGMKDVWMAGKQMVGQTTPEEVREHGRTASEADPAGWVRGAGTATMLAPLAMTPLATTIPGAIGTGAAAGVLAAPTENADVLAGKLEQGAVGGLTGGAFQGAINAARPLGRAIAGQIAQRTPFFPGTKQRIAEEAFTAGIPATERSAVESSLAGYQGAPRNLPGFTQTTGAVSRNPALLAAERQLREAGGEVGQPLRDLTESQAQSVAGAWRGEFGGRAAQAEAARDAFTAATTPGLVLKRAGQGWKPGDFDPVQSVIQNAKANAVGAELAAIKDVESMFYDALVKAGNSGSIEALHKFRRFGINDVLTKMYREGAPQSAVSARRALEQVKGALDNELDRLLQGQNRFSNFMQGYRQRSQALSQAEAGEKMLGKLEARPPTAAGTPQPGGVLQDIRTQEQAGFQHPRFGTPTYTPSGQNLLSTTAREVEQAQGWRSPTVGPTGSATAQNLAPMQSVLQKARAANAPGGFTSGQVGAGIGIGALTNPVLGVLVPLAQQYGLNPVRARALNDIAQRLVGYHTNPQAALDAIIKLNLPAPQQQYLAAAAQRLLTASAASGAAGALPAPVSAQ